MPDSRCIPNCTNRRKGKHKNLAFYRIAKGKTDFEKKRHELWIRAVARKDWDGWPDERISKQFVCGAHFVSEKRSDDTENIDFVPTVFNHSKGKSLSKILHVEQSKKRYKIIKKNRESCLLSTLYAKLNDKSNGETVDKVVGETDNPESTSTNQIEVDFTVTSANGKSNEMVINMYQKELIERHLEHYKLRKMKTKGLMNQFGHDKIKDNKLEFYTGLQNKDFFQWVLKRIETDIPKFHSLLSLNDHLLFVLMKLKLGLLNEDLADRFGITKFMVSKIYRSYICVLASKLKRLMIWPGGHFLPACFKNKYRDVVCIIDCTEVFIQRPSN